MSEQPKTKFGVYSAKAAAEYGSSFYFRPDGSEVELTCIFDDPFAVADYHWDDTEMRGEVTKYSRQGQKGSAAEFLGTPSYLNVIEPPWWTRGYGKRSK